MSNFQYSADTLTRHHMYLLRYANLTQKEWLKELKKLSKAVKKRIKLETDPNNQIAMRLLQEDIKQLFGDFSSKNIVLPMSNDLAESEIKYSNKFLQSIINVETKKVPTELLISSINKIPTKLVSGKKLEKLTISQLLDNFDSNLKKSVKNIINIGIGDGQTIGQISRQVSQIVDKRTKAQTRSVTRTIVNHVSNVSRSATNSANNKYLEGEKFVATLDGNTTFTCIKFDELGLVYKVGSGPQPPMHYGCRSVRVAVVKRKYQIPNLEGKRPEKSFDDEGNLIIKQTSSKTKYGSFLARQDKEFQDYVLGPKRAELFRSGKFKVTDFTDSKGRTLTLKELESKEKTS